MDSPTSTHSHCQFVLRGIVCAAACGLNNKPANRRVYLLLFPVFGMFPRQSKKTTWPGQLGSGSDAKGRGTGFLLIACLRAWHVYQRLSHHLTYPAIPSTTVVISFETTTMSPSHTNALPPSGHNPSPEA